MRVSVSRRSALAIIFGVLPVAVPPAAAIVGGRPVEVDSVLRRYSVLVELPGARCSGVIIAPRLVLSAAHCFGRLGRYTVRVAGWARDRMRSVEPLHVALHPEQNPLARKRRDNANDLALVLLRDPVSAPAAPVALLDQWRPAAGETLVAVGFGLNGSGHTTRTPLALRQVDLEPLDPNDLSGPIQRLFSGDVSETAAPAGACAGDSGGPVFRRAAIGVALVGVINWSIGKDERLRCGDMTGVTAIQAYIPWIITQSREWGVAFRP